jgi:hypothetical protein
MIDFTNTKSRVFLKKNVEKLLQLIPENEIEFLSIETKVNHQTKKLFGSTVFKLLLFSMLNNNKLSYRVMEKCFPQPVLFTF